MLFRFHYFIYFLSLCLFGCQHLTDLASEPPPVAQTEQSFTTLPSPHAAVPALDTTKTVTTGARQLNLPDEPVDFSTATRFVLTHSDKLLAEQAKLRATQLQADALTGLKEPMVFLSGSAGHYQVERDISTEDLRDRLHDYADQSAPLVSELPPELQSLLGKLPSMSALPSEVHVEKKDNFASANIGALWPIYTGGRIDAVQQYAQGRVDTQASDVAETKEALQTLLVKRYFLVQLAKNAVAVREQAHKAVKAHDHAAQRMFDVGMISQAERLQGATALAKADFQLDKAKDDLRLAQRALDSLLQSKEVFPATALFVNHEQLDSLAHFQQKARQHYPAFAKITAKKKQAQAVKTANDAAWHPTVSAFGAHQLSNSGKNWVLGVNARWTLNSPVDRQKMQQATQATLTHIDAVTRQAERDIDLLVEKNWLAVTDAVTRFDSLAKEQALAKEVVRLRTAGFREGLNTVIEVNDAEANLAKTRTARAKAAYDYATALADLLAAIGEPERFVQFIADADTRIDE